MELVVRDNITVLDWVNAQVLKSGKILKVGGWPET